LEKGLLEFSIIDKRFYSQDIFGTDHLKKMKNIISEATWINIFRVPVPRWIQMF